MTSGSSKRVARVSDAAVGRAGALAVSAERDRLAAENARLRQALDRRAGGVDLVGATAAMCDVRDRIVAAAATTDPVLVTGEPGTGRSLVALAIHRRSERPGAFLRIRCDATAEGVEEAQLFGVSAPVFGSASPRGALDAARGGSLFLHEAADLGLLSQARLHAALGDHGFYRTRDAQAGFDVRLLASSCRNLEEVVGEGFLRRDFFQWISTITIAVPALRDRRSDVPRLVDVFLEASANEHRRGVLRVSSRAMDLLLNYEWPGNVRELREVVDRAVVMATGPVLLEQHLPAAIVTAAPSLAPLGLIEALADYERELLEDALKRAKGVRSKAARLLKTTDRIFAYKLRRHGIDARQFKRGA